MLPLLPCLLCVLQVAVLLAPVGFATHVDSLPLTTLATLNTDEVGDLREGVASRLGGWSTKLGL
jgi:hypothetical protein